MLSNAEKNWLSGNSLTKKGVIITEHYANVMRTRIMGKVPKIMNELVLIFNNSDKLVRSSIGQTRKIQMYQMIQELVSKFL